MTIYIIYENSFNFILNHANSLIPPIHLNNHLKLNNHYTNKLLCLRNILKNI